MICTLGRAAVGRDRRLGRRLGQGRRARGRDPRRLAGRRRAARADGAAAVTAVFPAGLSYARNRGLGRRAGAARRFRRRRRGGRRRLGRRACSRRSTRVRRPRRCFGPVAPRDDRGLPYCRYDGGGELRVCQRPARAALDRRHRREHGLPARRPGRARRLRHPLRPRRGRPLGRGHRARSCACCAPAVRSHGRPTSSSTTRRRRPGSGSPRASRTPTGSASSRAGTATRCLLHGTRRRSSRTPAGRSARATAGACARPGRRCSGSSRASACGPGRSSPEQVLARAPDDDPLGARRGRGRAARPALSAPTRTSCTASAEDRLLHVYVEPKARLREGSRRGSGSARQTELRGIPRLLASGESSDALWVLEDRLAGRGAEAGRRGPLVRRSRPLGARARRAGRPACA